MAPVIFGQLNVVTIKIIYILFGYAVIWQTPDDVNKLLTDEAARELF